MPELVFTKDIHVAPEVVFDLIADLRDYSTWLPPSNLFNDVTEYSELPIRAGTTYVDQGKTTRMVGAVTEFERPNRITFRQVTTSRVGELIVEIRYTLENKSDYTHVTRNVEISASGGYRIIQMFLVGAIRTEVERLLEKMKVYLEANHTG